MSFPYDHAMSGKDDSACIWLGKHLVLWYIPFREVPCYHQAILLQSEEQSISYWILPNFIEYFVIAEIQEPLKYPYYFLLSKTPHRQKTHKIK